MKLKTMLAAAGLTIAALGGATAADAQDWRGNHHQRYDRGDRYDGYRDRGYGYRHYGWDRHRGYGWGRHYRHCFTGWRYHRRITICR